jgi:hypothetical protein
MPDSQKVPQFEKKRLEKKIEKKKLFVATHNLSFSTK